MKKTFLWIIGLVLCLTAFFIFQTLFNYACMYIFLYASTFWSIVLFSITITIARKLLVIIGSLPIIILKTESISILVCFSAYLLVYTVRIAIVHFQDPDYFMPKWALIWFVLVYGYTAIKDIYDIIKHLKKQKRQLNEVS